MLIIGNGSGAMLLCDSNNLLLHPGIRTLSRRLLCTRGIWQSLHAQGEAAMVGAAARAWVTSPQRAAMAIDRLMALRLVGMCTAAGAPSTFMWSSSMVHGRASYFAA